MDFYCENVPVWFQRVGLWSHRPDGQQRSAVIIKKKKQLFLNLLHRQSINWMSLSRCWFGAAWEDLHVNLHMLIAKKKKAMLIFFQGKYHALWMFDGPQLTIAPVRPHQSDLSCGEKDGRALGQPPVRNAEGKPISSQRRNAAGCKLSRQSG